MSDPVFILGIHDGHNYGATLIRDGEIVASVCEERITRRKNEVGYPRRAIEDCLRISGIDPSQLTEIANASLFMHRPEYLADRLIEFLGDPGLWNRFSSAGRAKGEKVFSGRVQVDTFTRVVERLV